MLTDCLFLFWVCFISVGLEDDVFDWEGVAAGVGGVVGLRRAVA